MLSNAKRQRQQSYTAQRMIRTPRRAVSLRAQSDAIVQAHFGPTLPMQRRTIETDSRSSADRDGSVLRARAWFANPQAPLVV
jgi:hypothetical protein